jgi:hypothetical protein
MREDKYNNRLHEHLQDLSELTTPAVANHLRSILVDNRFSNREKLDRILGHYKKTIEEIDRLLPLVRQTLEMRFDFLHMLDTETATVAVCLTPQFLRDVIASEALTVEQKADAIERCLVRGGKDE